MKQLTCIRLINWHLFENATIHCQGTTYFIGINGAGKSTILDAVQFALVGGQRDVRFNQAALSGGKRTLASYVRGELGTEGRRYLRGDATGVVALEFHNADGSYFVHGAVVDAFEDNRAPEVAFFIVHNAGLEDAWFFKAPGQLFDTRAFKRHLEHIALPPAGRAQVFTRLEDYRVHLLNRLGQLKDSFPAKVVKGLAFSPLIDIRSFVHNYLLDENLVDVKTLQAQLETLRHFESLAADVRERIAGLDRIEELDKERSANRRRRITNGYIARRVQGEQYRTELKNQRLQVDGMRLELGRAELQREDLLRSLTYAQSALLDGQVALQTDQAAARLRELDEKIGLVQTDLLGLRRRRSEFERSLAGEVWDARRLSNLLQEAGQALPACLQAVCALEVQTLPAEILTLQPLLAGLLEELESLAQVYGREAALLDEHALQLRSEAAQLQDEIRKVHGGDRQVTYESEAPQAVRLRRLLCSELGLDSGAVIFLCDLLSIPNPDWQDAVEGLLGHNRFALLVPSGHYEAAMHLYRRQRQADHLYGVALLDTERILAYAARTERPAGKVLAVEVQTSHPAARAFVDLLLGRYVLCNDLAGLRLHRTAVTGECFVRRNFTDSHLNPQVYRRWFIGERAASRQVEQRRERLEILALEMEDLQQRSLSLKQGLALTREKLRPVLALEHTLPELVRAGELERQVAAWQTERTALDLPSVEALRQEISQKQAQVQNWQNENLLFERHMGALEERLKVLEGESIPHLEDEIERALQSAAQFLQGAASAASELVAESEREYTRRLERQPLEKILQNAQHYENDYQMAEGRSRDRLREAKQAYSLRYDFGYDDQEDAARYLAEREKLIQSELPRYEERIAHQRSLAEQELVENFIHRLREQIEDARQQLAYLNATLAQLRFGGERFEFINQPAPALRQVYEMIMDSQTILGTSLLEAGFRQRHQQGWDLLFERLTAQGAEDGLSQELRELQDYRNYLHYDIRIHYPNGDRALLSQINAKKSGGETTTPFYVAMAASFAQAYRLNQPRAADTIRLALFDEAFGKMDTARTASALKFMRETGLQILLATPPDKSGALLPYVDCVCTVVRKENHAFVIEISKAELQTQLEQEA